MRIIKQRKHPKKINNLKLLNNPNLSIYVSKHKKFQINVMKYEWQKLIIKRQNQPFVDKKFLKASNDNLEHESKVLEKQKVPFKIDLPWLIPPKTITDDNNKNNNMPEESSSRKEHMKSLIYTPLIYWDSNEKQVMIIEEDGNDLNNLLNGQLNFDKLSINEINSGVLNESIAIKSYIETPRKDIELDLEYAIKNEYLKGYEDFLADDLNIIITDDITQNNKAKIEEEEEGAKSNNNKALDNSYVFTLKNDDELYTKFRNANKTPILSPPPASSAQSLSLNQGLSNIRRLNESMRKIINEFDKKLINEKNMLEKRFGNKDIIKQRIMQGKSRVLFDLDKELIEFQSRVCLKTELINLNLMVMTPEYNLNSPEKPKNECKNNNEKCLKELSHQHIVNNAQKQGAQQMKKKDITPARERFIDKVTINKTNRIGVDKKVEINKQYSSMKNQIPKNVSNNKLTGMSNVKSQKKWTVMKENIHVNLPSAKKQSLNSVKKSINFDKNI